MASGPDTESKIRRGAVRRAIPSRGADATGTQLDATMRMAADRMLEAIGIEKLHNE